MMSGHDVKFICPHPMRGANDTFNQRNTQDGNEGLGITLRL